MNREARGSRPQSELFSASCSANPPRVVSGYPGGVLMVQALAFKVHVSDNCENPSLG